MGRNLFGVALTLFAIVFALSEKSGFVKGGELDLSSEQGKITLQKRKTTC